MSKVQLIKLSASKRPYLILAGIAVIGLIDASYLTYQHYSGLGVICNLSHGCERVLNSQYAVVAGVPVALLGVIYYLGILLLSVYFLTNSPKPKILLVAGLAGFLPTLYLFYLQAFVIKAWCQYCLLSAITSTVIFIISVIVFKSSYKKRGDDESKA